MPTARPDWSPSTYLAFEAERTRPARDLLAQVQGDARHVIDVGCGPGNSTELLVQRWPAARIVGIDSSPAMRAEATGRVPSATFEAADATTWRPSPTVDVVYANATYQWVPDHVDVLAATLAALQPGAQLAVQMPDNLAEPTHVLMQRVGSDARWADRLAGAAREPLPPPRSYYEALAPHAVRIDLWHTIYQHVLADADAIVTWVKGTGLRPFLEPLEDGERVDFIADYTRQIDEAYPATRDGHRLLRFPRLFLVATRR